MRGLLFLLLGALTFSATAQPPAAAPAPVSVVEALSNLRSAYTQGTTAERIVVRVTSRSGRSSGSRVTVRLTGADDPAIRLDLADLQVFAGDAVIRAAHRAESRLYAEWPLDGPLTLAQLSRRLPPILLPHLAIALGEDESLATPFPPLPAVTWERTEPATNAGRAPRLTLHGSGPGLRVRLTVDPRTWRLWRCTADLDPPSDVARIELQCTAIEPGDPQSWRIQTDERQRVDDLTLLRPRAPEIAPGLPVGDLRLFNADLAPWSPPGDARRVVLLAFRPTNGAAADTQADAEAGLLAVAPVLRDLSRDGAPPPVCRVVALYEADAFDRDAFRALDALWSPAVSLASAAGERADAGFALWGSTRWLARFRPGYNAAVIVLAAGEGGLVLAAAIPLDGRSEDPAGIAEELRAALTPLP